MSIMWKYLDKRAAVIKVLEDYGDMQFIINNTDEAIKMVQERMSGLSVPVLDGMPRVHNPQAGENRILNGITEIDTLRERYRQALEYMGWFTPAWGQLTEDEKFILKGFYMEDGQHDKALDAICERFKIERSSAYNKKNRALAHLTTLLYGKY